MKTAAPILDVRFTPGAALDAAAITRVLEDFAGEPNGGLLVLPDTTTGIHRDLIATLAARHRLPAIHPFRFCVAAGGLMSYGIDVPDVFRRASYVDRILRGEKPGDLPVQAAEKFELLINRKVAHTLGLSLPPSLLARADEVVE